MLKEYVTYDKYLKNNQAADVAVWMLLSTCLHAWNLQKYIWQVVPCCLHACIADRPQMCDDLSMMWRNCVGECKRMGQITRRKKFAAEWDMAHWLWVGVALMNEGAWLFLNSQTSKRPSTLLSLQPASEHCTGLRFQQALACAQFFSGRQIWP